ncbi:CaiB/BaiF CoA-transferase family protein [Massilia sp. W12]|uniref:CaiB/BaiF CoA transferase family protein n=1 Tax=Massilia sp. W12 TaxID=3126507 RepID=UPI0030D2D8D8
MSAEQHPADLPLQGVRVLDLSRLLPGPFAAMRLAQLGADVLKIEEPGIGDYARGIGPVRQQVSQFFVGVNHGKRFARLDFKREEDKAAFLRMVRDADVVLESFRPGVMERLQLGWTMLRSINPKLVMCSLSGYGSSGPLALMAGHDLNYIAMSGMLQQNVNADGAPAIPNLQIGDLLGGAQQAVQGILAALLAVKMGQAGRLVEVAMADGVLAHNVMSLIAVNAGLDAPPAGADLLSGGVPCYNLYRCSDGRYMAVGALELKFWQILCTVLERPDLGAKHWMCGQTVGGAESRQVRQELQTIFARHSMAHWQALFADKDCCVTPVLTISEALHHPQFAQRHVVTQQEHESEGVYWQTGSGLRFHY